MLELVSNFDQKISFITGFAGSGKSTRLTELVTSKTLVLTPTHKAARVLTDKGVENVYTIHSALKLVPTLNKDYNPSKNQRMQRLKQIGATELADIEQIFIDEFSMISQDILDLLLSVLPANAEVVVFGDPFQLPPLSGEAIDPLIYTEDVTELTTQHRAEAPEVVETFMRLMNYIKTGDNSISLVLNPAIKNGTLEEFNPATDRILAYTNKKVGSLNEQVAKIMGLTKEYTVGEALTANQMDCNLSDFEPVSEYVYPSCMSKGKLMVGAELLKAQTKVENDAARWGTFKHIVDYPKCNIDIQGEDYQIYYDPDHYLTQQKLKAEVDKWQAFIYATHSIPEDTKMSNWCGKNRDKEGVKERGLAWSRQIAHSSLVFSLQRPFATTVHKSQGSEFATVFIAQADIKKSIRNGYYMNYARLMYVALSRAKYKVVIVK